MIDSSSGINFRNTVTDNSEDNSFLFRNFYNGGGVAVADINNDSLCDVLLTSNMGENRLYVNEGNWKFRDISPTSGMRQDSMWSTGAVFADINGDGWLDIYVCNSGHMTTGNRRNKLYINNRDLTFTEMSHQYGLDHSGYSTQASFFDYDMDGDLDCLIINNSPLPFSSLNYANMRDIDISAWQVDDKLKGGGNHLYKNNDNYFTEVTKEAGLHTGLISFGLGVSVGDINGDDYPDIYVGNDFIEKDYLYINQHDGTFKDELEKFVQQISMSSMSSDLGDINNDGYPEIFTTDMIPDDDYRLKTTGTFDNVSLYASKQKAGLYHQFVKNCLQLNNRNGSFSEISNYSGVYGTDWSWGALLFDADNDGLNDIFVCNGINKDLGDLDFLDYFSNDVYQKMLTTGKRDEMDEILKHIPVTPLANRVFKNNGDLRFTDMAKNWGLDQPGFSNSIAYGDLDNDGDLDLVINNENQLAFVYRNNSREQNGNSYIGFVLKGNSGNSYAVGSKIKVYKGSQVFYREVVPSRGFQSSVDYKQIIGVGNIKEVDSVVVTWPDRSVSRYGQLALNQVHWLSEPAGGGVVAGGQKVQASSLLEAVSDVSFDRHVEDDYLDFYYERNLPQLLSREGPGMDRADVNGDGLDDIYIGGASGQPGQLYIQDMKGGFIKKQQEIFQRYRDFEDVAVLFFDADGDKDQDLFIGSGGNNRRPGSLELQHRLYINDGRGNYSIDTKSFPNNDMNISVAVSSDYDSDGDLDLFAGSRSLPYNYGLSPSSYLYRNDGHGHFTDVTREQCAALLKGGMITDAKWSDITGDGRAELIITGEWMAPRIFSYEEGKREFKEISATGLEQLQGWWQAVLPADLNGDGKMDLVLGNIGSNFYLRPTATSPVKLWLNDFDRNGTMDQFLTRWVNEMDKPVFLKREITDQFPGLKKQNLRNSDYAKKSVQDLFGPELLQASEQKQFNYTQSVVAINEGGGRFQVKALPVWVQLSSVKAISVSDINSDGKADLVLGGNLFTFPPQFGRLDASYGHVLLGDGRGNFTWIDPAKAGINIPGEIKGIKNISIGGSKNYIIVTVNDQYPLLYHIVSKK